MRHLRRHLKVRLGALIITAATAFVLSGCTFNNAFNDACTEQGGTIMSDQTSRTVTSTGFTSAGRPTSNVTLVNVTVSLCVVDGDVVDIQVS